MGCPPKPVRRQEVRMKRFALFSALACIPKGTFKDGSSQDFAFAYKVAAGEASVATQPGASIALSLYESEDAFRGGKNPTVRFDNDGLQGNNKLLLKP